jgi:hypothetical protein
MGVNSWTDSSVMKPAGFFLMNSTKYSLVAGIPLMCSGETVGRKESVGTGRELKKLKGHEAGIPVTLSRVSWYRAATPSAFLVFSTSFHVLKLAVAVALNRQRGAL